jgi:hypothetical protein
VAPGAARRARLRFRGTRLRHEAADRHDPHLACVSDACRRTRRRDVRTRLRVCGAGDSTHDRGTVLRRHRCNHR